MNDERRTQLGENMRFYGDMRFKQLTLLIAWLTLAGAGVAQYGEKVLVGSLCVKQGLALSAVIFVGVLWIMEIQASLFWRAHRDQARDLWPRPDNYPFGWVNSTNALFVLHLVLYVFWLYCAFVWSANLALVEILGVIGVFILVVGVYGYAKNRLRKTGENVSKEQPDTPADNGTRKANRQQSV